MPLLVYSGALQKRNLTNLEIRTSDMNVFTIERSSTAWSQSEMFEVSSLPLPLTHHAACSPHH